MTLVVYAVATYFVDACIIFFACSNGMYECRNFCVKIWVVTLAVGTYDNTIERILLLLLKLECRLVPIPGTAMIRQSDDHPCHRLFCFKSLLVLLESWM